MIRIFGECSLWIAALFALLQCVLPLWGCGKNVGLRKLSPTYTIAVARPAAWGQFVFVVLAYALLTAAFITNDFSIGYVAANSHATLPLMYRATAVWGAHEGSILLWILILALWTSIFSVQAKDTPRSNFKPLVLAILGLMSVCFLAFLLLTSNPFVAAQPWQVAQDLNPLLQDPGFIIHPPMLYMGYVGFSTAFAITIASLLCGSLDSHWIRTAKQYAIAAWCFLTVGIMLGSWWAYRVLGWGGFWFWDPVENASLLPWLAGTALIHVLLLVEKRGTAKAWAALLAIICFSLSLLGTFLVRSGVLISAHTFASDPSRGVFLLLLLALLLTSALAIYLLRMPASHTQPIIFPLLSRETSLLVNSALLMIAMTTILLGTMYPLIIDALHLGTTLNGLAQPICTFLSKGPPSSTVTQEGLAIIMEIFTFSSYPDRVRQLTNRISTVNMVEQGANFFDVFEYFREQGLNEYDSYQSTVRVFRGSTPDGGPYTKDLSYSKGFILIYNYLRLAVQRGLIKRIPLLFVGKTTLEDLHILSDLMDEGILVPPKYVPPQFADLAAVSAWMIYSLFLNKLDLKRLAVDFRAMLR